MKSTELVHPTNDEMNIILSRADECSFPKIVVVLSYTKAKI